LKDWYANATNHSVTNLQVIAESISGFDPNGTDPLLANKVATFDFSQIVSDFDQARATDPQIDHWSVMNSLLNAHLGGSDTEAVGGDLAYQYGANGTLTGITVNSAVGVIADAQFGAGSQALRPLAGLKEGVVKLS